MSQGRLRAALVHALFRPALLGDHQTALTLRAVSLRDAHRRLFSTRVHLRRRARRELDWFAKALPTEPRYHRPVALQRFVRWRKRDQAEVNYPGCILCIESPLESVSEQGEANRGARGSRCSEEVDPAGTPVGSRFAFPRPKVAPL